MDRPLDHLGGKFLTEEEEEENRKRIQMIGIYMTIPFVLGISPIIGWMIGTWLDRYFETAPVLMFVLLFLGFVAGIRECYRIIKKYGNGGI